jgi:hypothetical protein
MDKHQSQSTIITWGTIIGVVDPEVSSDDDNNYDPN